MTSIYTQDNVKKKYIYITFFSICVCICLYVFSLQNAEVIIGDKGPQYTTQSSQLTCDDNWLVEEKWVIGQISHTYSTYGKVVALLLIYCTYLVLFSTPPSPTD